MRLLALALAMMIPGSAFAANWTAVQYECHMMRPARDGIKCGLADIEDQGVTLLIRIHSLPTSIAALRERTKYSLRKVMDSFMRAGGTFVIQRTKNQDGKLVERICSRSRGKLTEQCQQWDEDRDTDIDDLFEHLKK